MKKEDTFLIQILKAFVNEQKLPDLPEISLESLAKCASKHNVFGIVYYMLSTFLNQTSDSAISRFLREQYISTIYSSVFKENEVKLFTEKMEEAHISYAFFKGVEIQKIYPIPELRTMGDADVLVAEDDIQNAADILMSLDYEKSGGGSNVWSFHKGIMSFEVHRKLVAANCWNQIDYESYFEGIFEKLIPSNEGSRKYFSTEDQFIFLCFHIAKHLHSNGAGIRMFMDIAIYLRNYQTEMNWDYIWTECGKIQMTSFLKTLLFISREWFGVELLMDCDIGTADETTMRQLQKYIMSGGIFGFERDESIRRLRQGINNKKNNSSLFIKSRALWKIAFPDRKHMAYFIPAVLKHPILLPFAWCKRWKMGFENQWKMRAAVHGFSENVEEAKAEYLMLKRIGL